MKTCGKGPHREFPEEMTSAACRKEADVIKQASGSGMVIKQQEKLATDRVMRFPDIGSI